MQLLDETAPELVKTNLNNSKIYLKLGDTVNLTCYAEGKPKPEIIWTWVSAKEVKKQSHFSMIIYAHCVIVIFRTTILLKTGLKI